jgi:hypothetical protein
MFWLIFWLVNIFINEDFPTFDLPIKAYSGKRSLGHLLTSELLITNSAVLIFIFFLCKISLWDEGAYRLDLVSHSSSKRLNSSGCSIIAA